jgi:GDP-L-fucose synthase
MNKKDKIYVAGHTGLVGSAILRKLKEEGYEHIVVRTIEELDLRRQVDVEEFFKNERPDYVFLAAAKVGGILANNTYKAEFIYDNMAIALNVIHASYKYGVKKLLNLGSSCIYPKNCPQPMKEEYLLTGPLEPTNEPYAIAKISAIKLCRYYNEQYGTNFISVMPTNLYGPNDNFNLETAHVLPALIRKFLLAKLLAEGDFEMIKENFLRYPIGFGLDRPDNEWDREAMLEVLHRLGILTENSKVILNLWGTGSPYREFMHVDDLAEACLFLMERYDFKDIGEFINIGTGEDIKIKDLANMIKDIIGFGGGIKWDASKPDGTPRKLLDVSRIKALGWKPKVELEEGVKEVYRQLHSDQSRRLEILPKNRTR